jgi:hypothetical protein
MLIEMVPTAEQVSETQVPVGVIVQPDFAR